MSDWWRVDIELGAGHDEAALNEAALDEGELDELTGRIWTRCRGVVGVEVDLIAGQVRVWIDGSVDGAPRADLLADVIGTRPFVVVDEPDRDDLAATTSSPVSHDVEVAGLASPVRLALDDAAVFGSGSHPTTRLALDALTERVVARCRVLDVGCGSGVLTVAAARLGAKLAVGIDLDPAAVRTAVRNAERNGVADDCRFAIAPIEAVRPADAGAGEGAGARTTGDGVASAGFDVVVANILAGTLFEIAGDLERLAPVGGLVLSGVLAERADAVRGEYRRSLEVTAELDGWVLLAG